MIFTLKPAVVTFFLFASIRLHAQKWEHGVKFELNYSAAKGSGMNDSYSPGYSGGVWTTYAITEKIKLQPEFFASQYNYVKAGDFDKYYKNSLGRLSANDKIRLAYINLPLLFCYEIFPELSLLVGPQAGIVVFEDENLRKDGNNAFKNTEFSVNAGAELTLGTLGIYGRFNQGLSNISNMESNYKWQSQHIQFGVSLRIK
ncbi:MAG TPA: outer membrane beta-barrel protein [Agriterribacter sp.]|nr:outer membrane beta-barrel protein [Agriterribacter sp.]